MSIIMNTFQGIGLSRKDWYQQNGIPQFTLSYWIRKIRSEDVETEGVFELVFARLPTEQEADPNAPEPELEEAHPSPYKRKKRSGELVL